MTSNTPFPLGEYVGYTDVDSASTESAFEASYSSFVATMGTAPQFIDTYVDYTQPVSNWVSDATWAAQSNAATPDASGQTPVIGLPMASIAAGSMTADQQFQAFASGEYDNILIGIVNAWAAQGYTNLVFRPGWEMNIPGATYAGDSAQSQADWVAAFQHIYTVLHQAGAAAGVTVQVVWNPDTTSAGLANVTTALYPGNAYVDAIGADVYSDLYPYADTWPTPVTYHDWATGGEDTSLAAFIANPVNREHYWTDPAATEWTTDASGGKSLSLDNLLQFAEQQGKPFAIPETGAGNSDAGTDVNDDAAFPQWLAQQLDNAEASGEKIDFVNIWDSNGGGNYAFSDVSDGKPQEAAAWAEYFGAQTGTTIVATVNMMLPGQTIAPGGTMNTLLLQGPGVFDLRAPAVMTNIGVADVQGASASQSQTIYLRTGLDLTLSVEDAASVSVFGAANSDIINLGSSNAVVNLGGIGETFVGGTGNATFVGTALTIGGTITGGSGLNLLKLQGGGTVTMGSGITGIEVVRLDNAANYDFTANNTAALQIYDGTGNDTIAVGAASQQVFGSTGTLTVLATAADSGVAVYGAGVSSSTTLEITNSGTVTLNSGDKNLTVQLAAGDTLTLPYSTSIAVQGGGGDDTLTATNGLLRAGDTIAPGGRSNTLLAQGAGTFNLTTPTALSNIQTVDAQTATVSQSQVIDLRSGLDLTLNVQDSAYVTVTGAVNNDIINLGSGVATVTPGVGETVNGGSGNATFLETAATIGAAIVGGSGSNVMKVQNGGTVTMGSNITGVPLVYLDNSASYDFTANATAGLKVVAGAGNDTIAVGAASQQVFGSTGTLTVLATAVEGSAAVYGTGISSRTTLEINNSGTVTLNSGDKNLAVQLAAGNTLTLPYSTSIAVQGGAGDDTLIATNGWLRPGQTIAPGGGSNTLLLQGAGTFNLAGPAWLSNIQTMDVEGATVGQSQVIDLRAGLDLTLNVQDSANITLAGAANNDIINLGSGVATVTLGGPGETVNGGTGNATFIATAATIGAAIVGGSRSNVMKVQNGGTVTMGSNITGVSQVFLDNSASYNFIANATASLLFHAGTGNDTITFGAASQAVFGSTGTLTVKATAAEAGVAVVSGTGPTKLELTNGGTATLNAGDTNLTVQLDASTNLGLGGLGFITVIGAAAGGDTITSGGANQTLESTGGADTLTGSTKSGDTFLGTSIGLAGDLIKGFGGSDVIDITDISASTVQPLIFNSSTDQLTVTDGTHSVSLTFSGSYLASSFSTPTSDGHSGTLIKPA